MKKVTGIGGIFFKTKDAKKLNEWYIKHLGFTQSEDGIWKIWMGYRSGRK